jgi:hypothetical protein
MKKVLVILPLMALVACSAIKPAPVVQALPAPVVQAPVLPTEQYDNRAAVSQIDRETQVNRSIAQAPDWMGKLPISNNAVYANGSAVSTDMSMADYKAKLFAFGKICIAAGGKVDQQGKVFMQESGDFSNETSELAIKTMCPSVDITGTEVREIKQVSESNRYRTYVLVALPTGDANLLQKRKDMIEAARRAQIRSVEAFKELESQ